MFANKAVVTIVTYVWDFYRSSIIKFIMMPYVVYFILYNLLINCTTDDLIGLDRSLFSEDKETLKAVRLALDIAILPFIAFFLYIQFLLILRIGLGFFRKIWNVIDVCSLALNLAYVICDFKGVSQYELRAMASIGIILIWIKSFYFFRIFDETAPMVRMILVIIINIRWFLLIFAVSIIAIS